MKPDKALEQNRWIRRLTNLETLALSMVKEVDLAKVEPELIECRPGIQQDLLAYWRVMLSSEVQNPSINQGRRSTFLVVDKPTGAFLGLFAVGDPPMQWPQLDHFFGWSYRNEYGGQYPAVKGQYVHRFLHLMRCLPIYEFGKMTGGKLLTLCATSRDVIRLMELRYSYSFLWFTVRSLHGKASQYNRLNARGLEYMGVDDSGRSMYMMELRKKAIRHFKDQVPWGKSATHPLADQVQYWKDRWLTARCRSQDVDSIIRPAPDAYRLSAVLDTKKATADHYLAIKEDIGGDRDEDQEDE